jgi:uncharacterized membrane protein
VRGSDGAERHGVGRRKLERRRARSFAVLALVLSSVTGLAATFVVVGSRARAQESGGSFGGSSWDDEPSGGGSSSDWGSSGSSDWGGGSSNDDWAAREAERRADEERRAEQARREEEERRRREEEERRRREEEERRIAAERARKLALPPAARARELPWPAAPPRPARSATYDLASPVRTGAAPPSSWPAPPRVLAVDPPPGALAVGPMEWGAVACCGVPLLFVLLPLALLLSGSRAPWRNVADVGPVAPFVRSPTSPVRGESRALRVSIAFDWTARAALQASLAAMARRHDLRSRPGLHAAALEIASLLAAHATAARYVAWELAPPGDPRAWFQTRASDLRARFQKELVRNTSTEQAAGFVAREHEGQGLVVVSVVVGSKVAVPVPPATFDERAIAAALRAIGQRGQGETLALEVIWSPAAENDRMSSYELEVHYPELQRTSDGVGRTQCAYCRAPFPRELGRCPACGAPIA